MKKFFLTLLGVAFAAGVYAQEIGVTVTKVNVDKLKSAIAKSDAEIADAKKAAKAGAWLKRGQTFLDADAKPVNGLYMGMPESLLKISYGDAPMEEVALDGHTYSVYAYEHFKAYVEGGTVAFYVPTTVVDADALDKAYSALAKAYELDAKSAAKVKTALESVRGKSVENGGAYYSLREFGTAAKNFRRAYIVSTHPAVGSIDTMSLYYAGMSAVWAEQYDEAIKDLDKAIEMDYAAEGEAYRLKFLALYSLEKKEEALETLKAGISRYPANEDLIDMMMRYYAENDGDASSMIPLVEEAIAKNPANPSLFQGLARIYDKLGQNDNAIETIRKAVALAPDDFLSNYLEGLFILQKGDVLWEELSKVTFTSAAQYNQARDAAYEVFAQALAPLERAYALDPSEGVTVELLKNLTYRLRDTSAEMAEKNQKYEALYKALGAE